MKHSIKDLVTLRAAKSGFHIEHILSRNEENLSLFDGNKEQFEQERNLLGGVLLLKGKDNISSGNEPYQKKLESYASTLLWNETLRSDFYKSNLDFTGFASSNDLPFNPLNNFGPPELEERQRLLFRICKMIWPTPPIAIE